MSITSIAASGMTRATQRFERGAEALVSGEDMSRGVIETMEAVTQFKASAVLVRVSDEMLSNLLDMQRR